MSKRHGTHVILEAVTPDYDEADAEKLSYPNLRAALKSQNLPSFLRRSGTELWQRRFKFNGAIIQEDLTSTYLLNAVYRLQKARTMPEKFFWSAQVTTTSVALFGRPLSREVSSIALDELAYFERAAREYNLDPEFVAPVIDAYRSLISPRSKSQPTLEQRYSSVLSKLHEFFTSEYGECFACFDNITPDTQLSPDDLARVFQSVIDVLKRDDSVWNDWEVVQNRGAKVSVNAARRRVIIGKRRRPILARQARGLMAHEILVHARRAVEGAKRSHDLAIGLPDYATAEEGLGVLVETAINGVVSPKVKDHYVNIALALGGWRRRPLLRSEMYMFSFTRAVIRSVVNNDAMDLDEIERDTWEHVNRIYRGGLGNKYQTVFTKDVAYYQGFIKMANYLQQSIKRGRLTDSLAYVYSGKFDPTDRNHRRIVAETPLK